ncbi:MAG: type II secretion system F family protein [Myxococcales bacterium]|nr:type II secretion system F family protein [Myxococcales bacterium]
MSSAAPSSVLLALAVGLVALSLALVAYGLAAGPTPASRAYERYVAHLDTSFRLLFMPRRGRLVARAQLTFVVALLLASAATDVPYTAAWIVVAMAAPTVYLAHRRAQRLEALEEQVDGFVLALANALKTVPSPAAALEATVPVLPSPTAQEIELALKEVRVGSSLEDALIAMSARIRSRWVDVAVSAVLIGMRVGGNLPQSLERTASMIREIHRLLGVVRARTSQGRAQLWVLALFPAFVLLGFNAAQPGYFDPLQSTLAGQMCVGVATALWIASLLVGRKILSVDV